MPALLALAAVLGILGVTRKGRAEGGPGARAQSSGLGHRDPRLADNTYLAGRQLPAPPQNFQRTVTTNLSAAAFQRGQQRATKFLNRAEKGAGVAAGAACASVGVPPQACSVVAQKGIRFARRKLSKPATRVAKRNVRRAKNLFRKLF